MYYPPKPIEAYCYGEFGGPGGAYKSAPVLWNLAWLLLPNVEAPPQTWTIHPIQDDLATHMSVELYKMAEHEYPLPTARYIASLEGHPIQTHWADSTVGLMMERARSAEARLREGQVSANVVKYDFVLRRKANE